MLRAKTRLLDQDLKFLVHGRNDSSIRKIDLTARHRLHIALGTLVAIFIGGWLSSSPIASIEQTYIANKPAPVGASLFQMPVEKIRFNDSNQQDLISHIDAFDPIDDRDYGDHVKTIVNRDPDQNINSSIRNSDTKFVIGAPIYPSIPVLVSSPDDNEQSSPEQEWIELRVASGDTLSGLFSRHGLSTKDAIDISKTKGAGTFRKIKAGDSLWFKTDEQGQLDSVKRLLSKTQYVIVEREADEIDAGFSVRTENRKLDIFHRHVFGKISNSLYNSGLSAGLSDKLIFKLVSIFHWNIDFDKELQPGDQFLVIFEEKYADGEKVMNGEILAAEFINNGFVYRAVRHVDDDGDEGYFTPEGESLRRAFLRSPLPFSRVTSHYSKSRFHPILKTWRAHKGVDYGAPRGTRIKATADGRVTHVGRKGGYGKTVIIKHGNTYDTLYAHMSRYAKNLKVGSKVKQGQTIGHVGSTGFATGSHLHYEFRINGRHTNPLTVKLPRALPIENRYRQAFLETARIWTARLDAVSNHYLALNTQ